MNPVHRDTDVFIVEPGLVRSEEEKNTLQAKKVAVARAQDVSNQLEIAPLK
jgi:hypothetical protein